MTVRADSEFWSYRLVEELDDMGVEWSITLSQYPQVRGAIANITEDGWEPIGYTEDGEAQVAETFFTASAKKGKHRRVRVVVRRTRLRACIHVCVRWVFYCCGWCESWPERRLL